ncbi:MAG: hypothetical protein CME61_05205 [Halobacteriovoraceae bacterium]|nr:hypothetical protein [Halobacteriovoraceae bacterium]
MFFSFNVFSLETDNFLSWGIELKDSTSDLNDYINKHIQNSLDQINEKKKSLKCDRVRKKVILDFRGFITHPMERWVEETLGDEKVFPSQENISDREYFMMSVYGTKKFDVSKYFSLSRTININGIYFGTDKLSHWMSTGERYFRVYKKALRKFNDQDKAFKEAINYGIFLDRFILGGISSGVFSFGDLEANFQGLLFNLSFCESGEKNNLIVNVEGKWVMQHQLDIRDYVNPNFDETFNPSLYSTLKWDNFKENFLKRNCQKITDGVPAERFDYYQSILIPSFSYLYIEELKKTKKRLPPDQSRKYTNVCPNEAND